MNEIRFYIARFRIIKGDLHQEFYRRVHVSLKLFQRLNMLERNSLVPNH